MQKYLRMIASICAAVFMSVSLFAQTGSVVSGTIKDAAGEPLIGASVVVKGATTRGVVADVNGHYSIAASAGETLVFDCLGYSSQEVTLNGASVVNVVLQEDTNFLEETIVVGYAPMRKSDFTGSIASLKSDELQKSTATVGQALVGRVAGVEVRQTNGAPGAGVNIRVRGVNSLSASASPLYVIDGYPANDDVFINPNDIESIEILKDAASAAIYGSRGASGVVLITTKRGKDSESAKVTYDFSYGVQTLGKKIDLLNAKEFAQLYVDARNNSYWAYCQAAGVAYDPTDDNATRTSKLASGGVTQGTGNVGLSPYFWDFAKNDYAATAFKYDTDWQDEYFSAAGMMRHNVSVMGGTKNIKYMASLGYLDQDGIVSPGNHKQWNARLNLDAQINKHLSVSASYSMSDAKTRQVNTNGRSNGGGEGGEGYDGATQACIVAIPNFPAYNEDGTLVRSMMNEMSNPWGINSSENPLVVAQDIKINRTKVRNNLTLSATYEFIKDLKFKAQIGRMWYDQTYNKYRPNSVGSGGTVAYDPKLETSNHYAISRTMKDVDSLGEFTLTYKKEFGNHRIDALGGFTVQDHTYNGLGIAVYNLPDNRIQDISAAVDPKNVQETGCNRYEYNLLSYLARVNYSYSDRYTATASFRADGSSRFGAANKWGYFPSISGGWTLSNEPFIKDALKDIATIRLRASWGVSGNNNIGNYSSIAAIKTGTAAVGSSIVSSAYESAFVDPGLTWETTKQANIGLDLGFLNGRINLIANFYNSITTGVLYSVPIPHIAGSTETTTNLNDSKIRNRGFDLQLDARILEGPVTWTVGGNFSLNRNKVLYLSDQVDEIQISTMRSAPTHVTKVGLPIGSYMAFITDGIMSQADYQNVLKDRAVYIANGKKFPKDYTLQGPAVPDYALEYLSAGNVIYRDVNGDKLITDLDRTVVGDAYPDFTGGFNTSLSWKNFDLAMGFTFSKGAQIVNFNDYYCLNFEGSGNQYGIVRERYRSEAEPGNGKMPIAFRHGNKNTGMKVSDRYIDDADYFRLSTASIGYTFGKNVTDKLKIAGLRVYVNGDNLFTLTNYRGFNPEVDQATENFTSSMKGNLTPGFDWGSYPIARVITAGVNITF